MRHTQLLNSSVLVVAALLLLPTRAPAGPCEDATAYVRARREEVAAQQKLRALEGQKPAGDWVKQLDRLKTARAAAQQAATRLQKARRASEEELSAWSAVSAWLLAPAGTTDETNAWNRLKTLKKPAAIDTQVATVSRLRVEIANLAKAINQAEATLRNANRATRQELMTYRQEKIVPLELSIRTRMPGVPVAQLEERAADPNFEGFSNPEIEKLEADLNAVLAQLDQSRFHNVEEENKKKARDFNQKLMAAIGECRKDVQADLQELESRRFLLRNREEQLYGGEEGRQQVEALPANRKARTAKEEEFRSLRHSLINQHQAALKKAEGPNGGLMSLIAEKKRKDEEVKKLETGLKMYRTWETERDQAQQAVFEAQKRSEAHRGFADRALRAQAAALKQAVGLIEAPLATYRANLARLQTGEAQVQSLQAQWNQIAAKRNALQNEINMLKSRRVYTPQARARILSAWEPYRVRRDQFKTRKIDDQELNRLSGVIATRKRELKVKLLTSLHAALSVLTPYDCEAFPDARRSIGTIKARILELGGRVGTGGVTASIAGLGNIGAVVGFVAIPDLISPATDGSGQPLAPPTTTAKQAPTYQLYKTKITRQLVGKAVEEWEVQGFESSVNFNVDEPGYTSQTNVSVTLPAQITGDQTTFDIVARLTATWNLKTATHNLNAGLSIAGKGENKALEKWLLEPGAHTLNLNVTNTTAFGPNGMIRKWNEGGLNYRSVSVGFHSGVVQGLSGATITYFYREVK